MAQANQAKRADNRVNGQAGVPSCSIMSLKMLRCCRWFRSLRSVTVMGHYLPSAWNVSRNDAPNNPSARVPSMRLPVPSVQLARSVREAVLLVIGWPAR